VLANMHSEHVSNSVVTVDQNTCSHWPSATRKIICAEIPWLMLNFELALFGSLQDEAPYTHFT